MQNQQIVSIGHYLDDQKLHDDYGMQLDSLTCISTTGVILVMDFWLYQIILKERKTLDKNHLHEHILEACPPMVEKN